METRKLLNFVNNYLFGHRELKEIDVEFQIALEEKILSLKNSESLFWYCDYEDSGNLFYNNKIFKEYVRSTGLNLTDLTINMYVSKLAKKDILIKQCQGTYMLNPLYFFKGKLSDRTRIDYHIVVENKK